MVQLFLFLEVLVVQPLLDLLLIELIELLLVPILGLDDLALMHILRVGYVELRSGQLVLSLVDGALGEASVKEVAPVAT